jgi:hypothetical protein
MSPIPWRAAQAAGQSGDKGQNQGKNDKDTSAQALPLVNKPIHPIAAEPNGGPVEGKDKENSVNLTGLPPVRVISKEKTFLDHVFDWGPWVFNFGLVAVGVLQVVLLKRQANIMDKQAKDVQETGAGATKIALATALAAQKSADAAAAQIEIVKNKDRAQLRIEFAEPDFTFNEELGGYPIRYQIILDGPTRIYILQDAILAYMGRTAREKKAAWAETGIPRTLTPEMSPFEGHILVHENIDCPEVDTNPGILDLVHQNFTVFVDGDIYYEDVFRDKWVFDVDHVWVPNSRYSGEGATGGRWQPFGSGRHDAHRRVE